MSAIFLLPVCLTYWPRKNTTRVDQHVDNFHQVWSWYDHPLPRYSVFVCRYATWPGDHDLWPFDLEQLSYMAGQVANPATKFEDPTTISSWVTSYNVSRWLPLKMRMRPLRVRRVTWPVSRGWKRLRFWYAGPRFVYSLYNFGGSTMNIIIVICTPCVKNVWDSAHVRNHVICLRWPKCLNAVVLADVDLPHVDNFHQVWSWYDHPLPSYSVFVCWYVTWPGARIFKTS